MQLALAIEELAMGGLLLSTIHESAPADELQQQPCMSSGLSLAAAIVEAKHQIAYLAGTEPDSVRILIDM